MANESKMSAFQIMREWDEEAGHNPRSDDQLQLDVAGSLTSRVFSGDWQEWLEALEGGEVSAIVEGRAMWGLSPL